MELADDESPLHNLASAHAASPTRLPHMPLDQQVAADYATVGLSHKAHPTSFVRPLLDARGVITASAARFIKSDHKNG